jgi:lysozyme
MITDPESFRECIACYTTAPAPSEVFIDLSTAAPSHRCLEFIAGWEACRLSPYDDNPEGCPEDGDCTIGIGHRVHEGCCDGSLEERRFEGGIPRDEAWSWLEYDAAIHDGSVRSLVQVPLTQRQFDAPESSTYNIGGPNLATSGLHRRLNQGDYESVPDELMEWVFLACHEPRRRQEGWMFVSGAYITHPILCQ